MCVCVCVCVSSDMHMYIYAYVYIYLDIYVGRFWKFHSSVICIKLMACNKAGVDRNEYNCTAAFPLAPFNSLLV